VGFEPDDAGEASDGRLRVRLSLARRRVFGASDARPPVPDEDEIVFAGGPVVLVPGSPEAPPLRVADVPEAWAAPVTLLPSRALRAATDPPACPDAARASVLAWYVETPAAERFAPDDALRRRLRGLGYLDEPEDGATDGGEAP